MISLFGKRKQARTNAIQDRMAQSIVTRLIRLQQRWADAIQRQTCKLSISGQRIALTLFCLAAVSFSIYLIAASLAGHTLHAFSIPHINVPAYSLETGDKYTKSAAIITKPEYERINTYHCYIDSLARSPTGKLTYDSLLSRHPGLIDSLSFIENIYHSQTKK